MDNVCTDTTFAFTFVYDDTAPGPVRHLVRIGSGPTIDALTEDTTQGFTWSTEKQVYTMLYLYNDAYSDSDPPEFLLVEADANGRLDAVIRYFGTCEEVE
jgi:hypothetical protein